MSPCLKQKNKFRFSGSIQDLLNHKGRQSSPIKWIRGRCNVINTTQNRYGQWQGTSIWRERNGQEGWLSLLGAHNRKAVSEALGDLRNTVWGQHSISSGSPRGQQPIVTGWKGQIKPLLCSHDVNIIIPISQIGKLKLKRWSNLNLTIRMMQP